MSEHDISEVMAYLEPGVRAPKHPPAGSRGRPTPAHALAHPVKDPAVDLRGAEREQHLANVRHVESYGPGDHSTERPRNVGPGGGARK